MRLTYAEALEELQSEYRQLRREFDDLQASDAAQFEAMRDEMAEALAQLKAEINEVSDQFGQLVEPKGSDSMHVETSL